MGGFLFAIGFRQLPYSEGFILVCYSACLVAITMWLNRDREQRYAAEYRSMAKGMRIAFGVAAVVLIAWPFWEIPRRGPPTPVKASISCPREAEELTAECS